jgi:hypothetical protein
MRNLTTTFYLRMLFLCGFVLTVNACAFSGTSETRIISSSPHHVKTIVYQPMLDYSKGILLELSKSRELARRWCGNYGKKVRSSGADNSFFKTITYQCVSPKSFTKKTKNNENTQIKAIENYKNKCQEMGFTRKTDKFADCVLRLMEMQSNKRPQTVIQNNTGDSSAVRALLEEQKKQRQLEGSLELMKRGFEMMSPPKPKLTCKYNSLTKTTVCN